MCEFDFVIKREKKIRNIVKTLSNTHYDSRKKQKLFIKIKVKETWSVCACIWVNRSLNTIWYFGVCLYVFDSFFYLYYYSKISMVTEPWRNLVEFFFHFVTFMVLFNLIHRGRRNKMPSVLSPMIHLRECILRRAFISRCL